MGLDQYARAHLWASPGRAEQQQSDVKIKVGLHALVSLFIAVPHLPKLESFCQQESPRTPWTPDLAPGLLLSPSLSVVLFLRLSKICLAICVETVALLVYCHPS